MVLEGCPTFRGTQRRPSVIFVKRVAFVSITEKTEYLMLGKEISKFPFASEFALVHDTKPPSAYEDGQVLDQSMGSDTARKLTNTLQEGL